MWHALARMPKRMRLHCKRAISSVGIYQGRTESMDYILLPQKCKKSALHSCNSTSTVHLTNLYEIRPYHSTSQMMMNTLRCQAKPYNCRRSKRHALQFWQHVGTLWSLEVTSSCQYDPRSNSTLGRVYWVEEGGGEGKIVQRGGKQRLGSTTFCFWNFAQEIQHHFSIIEGLLFASCSYTQPVFRVCSSPCFLLKHT